MRITSMLNQYTIGEHDLLSRTQVQEFLGISRWTLSKLLLSPDFPKPYKLSVGIARWKKSDLSKWLESRNEQ